MDESASYLQSILGTDKRNPVFSVSKHSQTGQFHVYYGFELFEIVPSDRGDTRFKLMVAHLFNVGIKLTALHEAFGVDPRTIKKWGNALKSGDAQRLIKALAGRGGDRKLTPAVMHFVRMRFPAIYRGDRYTYSRRIREELKELLQVILSGETLRPLLGELKAQFEKGESQANDAADDTNSDTNDESQRMPGRHQSPQTDTGKQSIEQPSEGATEECEGNEETAHGLEEPQSPSPYDKKTEPDNRKESAEFFETRWCSHLGLLLFSHPLLSLVQALGPSGATPVCQWLSQVLMGASNLEQSKLISRRDLELLLG